MAKRSRVVWNPRSSVAVNARRELPRLTCDYFRQARKLLGGQLDPAVLHRVRLLSKRLRYTLELFQPCYPAALNERLEALKRVQELLGDINDAVVAARLIASMPNSVRMCRYLEDVAVRKAAECRVEWNDGFGAPGSEAWWLDFLSFEAA